MAPSSLTLQPVRSSTARNPLRAAAAAAAATSASAASSAGAAAPRRTSSATDPLRASVADRFLSHDLHLRSHSASSDTSSAVARFRSAVSSPAAGEQRVGDFPRYAHLRYDSTALPRAASDPSISAIHARVPAAAGAVALPADAAGTSYGLSEPHWEWEEATSSSDAGDHEEESHGDGGGDDDDLPGVSGRVFCDVLAGGGASPSGERRETADDVMEWQQLTHAVMLCLSGATAAESRLEESVNDVLGAIALAQTGGDADGQSQAVAQSQRGETGGAFVEGERASSSDMTACPGCDKAAERVALAAFLAAMGHDVILCKSMWTANQDMPPGHYHFLEVSLGKSDDGTGSSSSVADSHSPPTFRSSSRSSNSSGSGSSDASDASSAGNSLPSFASPGPLTSAVVDVSFQQQFHVARPSRRYQQLLALLPRVFVGSYARLRALVRLMAAAAQQSLLTVALPIAPWRKARYMAKLWFPQGAAASTAAAAAAAATAGGGGSGGGVADNAGGGGGGLEGSVRNGVVRRRVVWGAVAGSTAGASEVAVASLLRQLPLCCKHVESSTGASRAAAAAAAAVASPSLLDPRVQLIASRLLTPGATAVGGAAVTTALHRIQHMMDQLSSAASAAVTPATSTSRSVHVPSAAAASITPAPSPFSPSASWLWSPPAVSPKQRPANREGSLTRLFRSQEKQRREEKEAPMAFHMAAAT
ncbi:unnamed protein product [Closterium sp. NIES-65]|nr:unnamed protein product [Closterium sp. NIES-65]